MQSEKLKELRKLEFAFNRQAEYVINCNPMKHLIIHVYWKYIKRKRFIAFTDMWESGLPFNQCFTLAKQI